MNKRVMLVLMLAVLLLAACESKTTGKRTIIPETSKSPITGASVSEPSSVIADTTTGKSAAEALKVLQENPDQTSTPTSEGQFYPPVTSGATGEDALREKTKALMTQPGYVPNVDADKSSGAKYHDDDGDPKNLPSEYSDNTGD